MRIKPPSPACRTHYLLCEPLLCVGLDCSVVRSPGLPVKESQRDVSVAHSVICMLMCYDPAIVEFGSCEDPEAPKARERLHIYLQAVSRLTSSETPQFESQRTQQSTTAAGQQQHDQGLCRGDRSQCLPSQQEPRTCAATMFPAPTHTTAAATATVLTDGRAAKRSPAAALQPWLQHHSARR
jgi:hypothetical protein